MAQIKMATPAIFYLILNFHFAAEFGSTGYFHLQIPITVTVLSQSTVFNGIAIPGNDNGLSFENEDTPVNSISVKLFWIYPRLRYTGLLLTREPDPEVECYRQTKCMFSFSGRKLLKKASTLWQETRATRGGKRR